MEQANLLPRFLDAADPLEKSIEKAVVAYAKTLGFISYKFTSPARRSVPDRMFIAPGGRVLWVEFKRRGAKPTKAQLLEILSLRAMGCAVSVVSSIKEGKELLELFR